MTDRRWLGLVVVGIGVVLIVVVLAGVLGPSGDPAARASPSASLPASGGPLPLLGTSDVEAFVPELVVAVQDGDVDFLLASLHPATIDRYGEEACRIRVSFFDNPLFAMEVLEILDPAPWDYVTDDVSTTIPDAWEVRANLSGADVPPEAHVFHFAPAEGEVRWFTDCGSPL
jgi:hypothetical protein